MSDAKPARCPNPSCGSDDVVVVPWPKRRGPAEYTVVCQDCETCAGPFDTEADGIAAWAKMGAWRVASEAAERLARALVAKHYPDNKSWQPLSGDIIGLIYQIDNMTCGLARNGGWRDIATAPMDGSEIIAACYGDKTSGSYYWESEPNHWGETGWQEEDARGGPKLWRHPSKLDVWRPLPEPPKEES